MNNFNDTGVMKVVGLVTPVSFFIIKKTAVFTVLIFYVSEGK
jgi:hypothetical protein